MYYANGVALAADESYIVICETDRIRLLKYWLKGPKVCSFLVCSYVMLCGLDAPGLAACACIPPVFPFTVAGTFLSAVTNHQARR
jgi:hypothetical protein